MTKQSIRRFVVMHLMIGACIGLKVDICAGQDKQHASPAQLNPTIVKIVDNISADSLRANLQALVSFGTRNTFSDTVSATMGIGAARRWIYRRFKSFSAANGNRLKVSFDFFDQPLSGRATEATGMQSVRTANVVAVLPGTKTNRMLAVGGHYDSMNRDRYDGKVEANGANDDGSGTAVVMELARVMSQFQFEHTLAFIAFTGEEQGLWGSSHYAKTAKERGEVIDAAITNDIVGNIHGGDGSIENNRLRCFSPDPVDSDSRQLARHIRKIASRYVPELAVDLIFRLDRVGRGGDHRPFTENGYAGVRFTEANENFSRQHVIDDKIEFVSFDYMARVAKVNATALASLALAPPKPEIIRIQRDRDTYETAVAWRQPENIADLSHFNVLARRTIEPDWTEVIPVGMGNAVKGENGQNNREWRLRGRSIDEYVFGLAAVDQEGNESLAATFDWQAAMERFRQQRSSRTNQ
ncbi:M20/M25/M40 family metallo-hydrolase [candidate division KSB1 bacterium]|nr:M20/M25/M40 family metallo-hydrolase [candidate division KSB1 bacterium]